MSHFIFNNDKILRKNLDTAIEYIAKLISLSQSKQHRNKPILVSNLRKSIIIHTASVIEALLCWKIKQKINNKIIELSDEWKYYDIKVLHIIANSKEEVIAGKRKLEQKNLDRLDFLRIIDISLKYKIINKKISVVLHQIRETRNKLHIGGLKEIEKKYTKRNLEFAFIALLKTIQIVSK